MAPKVRDVAESAPSEAKSSLHLQRVFARMDPVELRLVRRAARHGSRPVVLRLALLVNRLGDGWLYPLLALMLVAGAGRRAIMPILAATLSGLVAHAIFPFVKRYLARSRPFETDATLTVAAIPLDKYSCPSGHAMTAAAIFLPWTLAFPQLELGFLALWCLIGWARILLAHHYASDLVAGAALGCACGAVGSLLLLVG